MRIVLAAGADIKLMKITVVWDVTPCSPEDDYVWEQHAVSIFRVVVVVVVVVVAVAVAVVMARWPWRRRWLWRQRKNENKIQNQFSMLNK